MVHLTACPNSQHRATKAVLQDGYPQCGITLLARPYSLAHMPTSCVWGRPEEVGSMVET